jgi:hypothetical protein
MIPFTTIITSAATEITIHIAITMPPMFFTDAFSMALLISYWIKYIDLSCHSEAIKDPKKATSRPWYVAITYVVLLALYIKIAEHE